MGLFPALLFENYMSQERVLSVLRLQAWERAKGELQALLHSYYPTYSDPYDTAESLISKFIADFEANCL